MQATEKYGHHRLEIDGVRYPHIDEDNLPVGFCKVPVTVINIYGKCEALMIDGSIGISCSSSGETTESGGVGLDSMQPQTGWWMFEKRSMLGL